MKETMHIEQSSQWVEKKNNKRNKKKLRPSQFIPKILRGILIIGISLTSLFPFYTLVVLSLSNPKLRLGRGQGWWLPGGYVENFTKAWETSGIGQSILNSLIITMGAVLVIILLASMAGYGVARVKTTFNKIAFSIMLGCMMIPGIINTVPLYTLMHTIGGINTYWAMILVLATNALPFSTFLYSGFIKTLNKELEEAAIIDGTTRTGAFWYVIFPLLKPVTSAIIIINGLGIWNNYAQAVFFLQKQRMRTIPIAISMFFQQYGAKWHLMAAASVIGLTPAVLTFIVFQRYFIKGISAGSVKG